MKSKTRKGIRVIPLNADAMEAIWALYRREQQIGGANPEHYVFFACENGRFDPSKPQKSWRSAWRSLRKVAGLLPKLRFHDLRHQAITELAEYGNSDQPNSGASRAIRQNAKAGHIVKHGSRTRRTHLPPTPTWTCPNCQHVRTPATPKRLDSVTLECERCKRPFPSVLDKTKPSQA